MKTYRIFLLAILSLAFWANTTRAEVKLVINEVDGNVVVTGSGSFNLADLSYKSYIPKSNLWPSLKASTSVIYVGPAAYTTIDVYDGIFSGPSSFGDGNSFISVNSGTGDTFGFALVTSTLYVPEDYVSGVALSATSTYEDATLSNLGLTSGIYTWTWGSGENADYLELTIVPEPATYAALIGVLCLGLVAWRRKSKA
ncbi:PEP-CTERM sorting domain-containing protein [Ruficoccus sp. ZRK36]|uniref:PEP-CTERM sorting domain-containing protein n=1 Tax=Ruficoccus sp. ZRK36 TaxID=2866311 RepID=UPI001C73A942|nr:PEP-CTERM sorting domain-containing protein [Ruficoccus sp. ZRK36]QYY37020.1 PEP-CTERM sorting domain-containing protein [Ruficoccus sp. ZRK36]